MRILSVVPERSPRRQTGTPFAAKDGRAASIARFLGWTSPLNPTSKEDQAQLGLTTAQPRAEDTESPDDSPEEEALV